MLTKTLQGFNSFMNRTKYILEIFCFGFKKKKRFYKH